MGLTKDHEKVFNRLESEYVTPGGHETHSVTIGLMAPTIRLLGTDQQKADWVDSWARCETLCCQLFSEPGAGSDLASVAMKADRDGDEWVLNGQKVWSSGAQFSEWGMAVCRSDSDLPKHKGITVFVLPMDAPGVEIRQIRQMSGGTSFNEVFFSDVRIPDAYRIGDVGEGWKVALTVLGFERGGDGGGGRVGGTWAQVKALADHFEAWSDPVLRDDLANLYIRYRLMAMTRQRIAAQVEAGQAPGPEGSIGKVFWTDSMAYMSDVVGRDPRPAPDRRQRRVGHLRVERPRARRTGLPHRRRLRRDPEEHRRRTGAGPAGRTARRQDRRVQRRPEMSPDCAISTTRRSSTRCTPIGASPSMRSTRSITVQVATDTRAVGTS